MECRRKRQYKIMSRLNEKIDFYPSFLSLPDPKATKQNVSKGRRSKISIENQQESRSDFTNNCCCETGNSVYERFQSSVEKSPLEPCSPMSEDPESWVFKSSVEIPIEYWFETLNFDDDFTTGRSAVAKKTNVTPTKAAAILESGEYSVQTSKRMLDKLHKNYLKAEEFDKAEALEKIASDLLNKKIVEEFLNTNIPMDIWRELCSIEN